MAEVVATADWIGYYYPDSATRQHHMDVVSGKWTKGNKWKCYCDDANPTSTKRSHIMIYSQFLNLKVQDTDGNLLSDVTITLKDKNGDNGLWEDLDVYFTSSPSSATDTSLTVDDASGLATNDEILWWGEIMKITNIAGNVLTVERGLYNSSRGFNFNDRYVPLRRRVVSMTIDGPIEEVYALERVYYKYSLDGGVTSTGNLYKDYNPYTLGITKDGYTPYEVTFTLDKEVDWSIALSDPCDSWTIEKINEHSGSDHSNVASYSVSWNEGTDTLTTSNNGDMGTEGNPLTFEQIWAFAAYTKGTCIIEYPSTGTYVVKEKLRLENSFVKTTQESIKFTKSGNVNQLYVDANSGFQSGEMDAYGTPQKGSSIDFYASGQYFSVYIYGGWKIYDSLIYCSNTNYPMMKHFSGSTVDVRKSIFEHWRIAFYLFTTDVYMNDVKMNNCKEVPFVYGADVPPVTRIQIFNTQGTPSPAVISTSNSMPINTIAAFWDSLIHESNPIRHLGASSGNRNLRFINSVWDETKYYWQHSAGAVPCWIESAFTIDLKVIDKNNAGIENTKVSVKDQYGNIVSYVDSEANLNEVLDTSETGVDVTDGSKFSENDIILIDSEYMLVTNVASNTLTVARNYYSSNYFASNHGNGKDIYIVKAIDTSADGVMTQQVIIKKHIQRNQDASVTVKDYNNFTLQITHQDYPSREFDFTLDKKIDWTLALSDSPQSSGMVNVYGTEYAPNEEGVIYAQVLYGDGSPANSAVCDVTIFNKNTTWVSEQSMTYISGSDGSYYYNFTVPSNISVFMTNVKCSNPTAYGSGDFHVSTWARDITQGLNLYAHTGSFYSPSDKIDIYATTTDNQGTLINTTVDVEIFYPNGTSLNSGQAGYYESGRANYTFTLPNNAPIGTYRAEIDSNYSYYYAHETLTFLISPVLEDISDVVDYINTTITNTIIPYLQEINSTTHTSYTYLTDTIKPQLDGIGENISYIRDNMATSSALSSM